MALIWVLIAVIIEIPADIVYWMISTYYGIYTLWGLVIRCANIFCFNIKQIFFYEYLHATPTKIYSFLYKFWVAFLFKETSNKDYYWSKALFIVFSASSSLWSVATVTTFIDGISIKFLKIRANMCNNINIFYKFFCKDLESRFIVTERRVNATRDALSSKLVYWVLFYTYMLILLDLYMLAIAHYPSRRIIYNFYALRRNRIYRLIKYYIYIIIFYLTSPLAIAATRLTKSGNRVYLIYFVSSFHYCRIILPISLLFYLVFFISWQLFFFKLREFILYYILYLLYQYQYFRTLDTVSRLNLFFKKYTLSCIIIMYIIPCYITYAIYCLRRLFMVIYYYIYPDSLTCYFFLKYFACCYFSLPYIFLIKNFFRLLIYLCNYIYNYVYNCILFWYKLFLRFFKRFFYGRAIISFASLYSCIRFFKVIFYYFKGLVFLIPTLIKHKILLPKIYDYPKLTIIFWGELITIGILKMFIGYTFSGDYDDFGDRIYTDDLEPYYRLSIYIYLGCYIAYFLYIY